MELQPGPLSQVFVIIFLELGTAQAAAAAAAQTGKFRRHVPRGWKGCTTRFASMQAFPAAGHFGTTNLFADCPRWFVRRAVAEFLSILISEKRKDEMEAKRKKRRINDEIHARLARTADRHHWHGENHTSQAPLAPCIVSPSAATGRGSIRVLVPPLLAAHQYLASARNPKISHIQKANQHLLWFDH